jgi:glycerophosphoryl diester phosphodiesterase
MKIFGHRGASGYAPENTIASMKVALEQGCHGIELDAQLTKDNEVVICHDWVIDGVSDGSGEVGTFTLDEIRKFDFGSSFSEKFKGEKIPTLYEILDFLPRDIILNIELKIRTSDKSPLVEKVAEILMNTGRIENTIISSFNHPCLKKIKKLIPELRIALLYSGCLLNIVKYIAYTGLDIYSLHLDVNYIDEELVKELHHYDKKVYIWTSNDIEITKKLMEIGVDGVMTNFPIDMINIVSGTTL